MGSFALYRCMAVILLLPLWWCLPTNHQTLTPLLFLRWPAGGYGALERLLTLPEGEGEELSSSSPASAPSPLSSGGGGGGRRVRRKALALFLDLLQLHHSAAVAGGQRGAVEAGRGGEGGGRGAFRSLGQRNYDATPCPLRIVSGLPPTTSRRMLGHCLLIS